jgi:hypothetical protein
MRQIMWSGTKHSFRQFSYRAFLTFLFSRYPSKGYGTSGLPPAPSAYNSIGKPAIYSDHGNSGPSTMSHYNPYVLPRRTTGPIAPSGSSYGAKSS